MDIRRKIAEVLKLIIIGPFFVLLGVIAAINLVMMKLTDTWVFNTYRGYLILACIIFMISTS